MRQVGAASTRQCSDRCGAVRGDLERGGPRPIRWEIRPTDPLLRTAIARRMSGPGTERRTRSLQTGECRSGFAAATISWRSGAECVVILFGAGLSGSTVGALPHDRDRADSTIVTAPAVTVQPPCSLGTKSERERNDSPPLPTGGLKRLRASEPHAVPGTGFRPSPGGSFRRARTVTPRPALLFL